MEKPATSCQQMKAAGRSEYGTLASLQMSERPWSSITMDFTELPPSRKGNRINDSILDILDRYTNIAKYFTTRKTIDAPDLGEPFLNNIVKQHGTPVDIVPDRRSVFTTKFWSLLYSCMKIKRKLSTAFHLQTDGQTEGQSHILEHYSDAIPTIDKMTGLSGSPMQNSHITIPSTQSPEKLHSLYWWGTIHAGQTKSLMDPRRITPSRSRKGETDPSLAERLTPRLPWGRREPGAKL